MHIQSSCMDLISFYLLKCMQIVEREEGRAPDSSGEGFDGEQDGDRGHHQQGLRGAVRRRVPLDVRSISRGFLGGGRDAAAPPTPAGGFDG